MSHLIGNTPLIKIKYKYQNNIGYVYSKLEYYNLTGSIKDRMAYYVLKKAKEKNILKDGMKIVEVTSGNTGISLAALGAYFHHPVYIFLPDWVSKERVNLLKLYGANVTLVSKEEGGFLECLKQADHFAKKYNAYRPNQFSNKDNTMAHYETTGKEIEEQLQGKEVGGIALGIGTGGTLMGIAQRLKETHPNIITSAIEPSGLPVMSKNITIGSHKIEGIGDEFIPEIVDTNKIDKIYTIDDDEAIAMSQKLSKELGLGVGISSGANILGAILLREEIKKDTITVFPDDNKKYLSTDLLKEVKENNRASQIEFISYEVISESQNQREM